MYIGLGLVIVDYYCYGGLGLGWPIDPTVLVSQQSLVLRLRLRVRVRVRV